MIPVTTDERERSVFLSDYVYGNRSNKSEKKNKTNNVYRISGGGEFDRGTKKGRYRFAAGDRKDNACRSSGSRRPTTRYPEDRPAVALFFLSEISAQARKKKYVCFDTARSTGAYTVVPRVCSNDRTYRPQIR